VFDRRWVRCDADGGACTYIQEVASTDPETGPTYVIRADDLGYTLRLRVTADVNNDTLHNVLPQATEVDTAPSAVVTNRPLPSAPPGPPGGGPGGGGPGGGGAPDIVAPVITGVSLTKAKFVAGKGTTFNFRVSEPGSVRIVISKSTTGRKVGKTCKPKTRKNRRKKRCKYQKTVTTINRPSVAAGNVSIRFTGKIGKRKLAPGTYRATFIVRDAAGNTAKAVTLVFKIVRR